LRRFVPLLVFLGLMVVVRSAQISMMLLKIPSPAAGKLPDDWTVKVNHGTPEIATGSDPQGSFVELRSHKSSFSLERGLDVDLTQYPYLCWRWKVGELPSGGDFRRPHSDDQAAQVLVAFQDRRVLTYIWDTTAPKGTEGGASSIPLVHIFAVVCESGPELLNRWISEARNLAQDYQRAYGRPAPRVKGIRLQINSQHTATSAKSQFAEVTFRSTPQ
jgi:hypothetical protein